MPRPLVSPTTDPRGIRRDGLGTVGRPLSVEIPARLIMGSQGITVDDGYQRVSISLSPLLALPLELRIKIYVQLLSPYPGRVYILYHDRHGRDAFSSGQSLEELTEAGRLDKMLPPCEEAEGVTRLALLTNDPNVLSH